ncbi:MAG: hypothetical protein PVG38_17070 [Gammaproteobacteria bacterium]
MADIMAMLFTGEMGWQRFACRSLGLGRRGGGRLFFGRRFHRCPIPQQAQLIGIERFCAAAKLAALQLGDNQIQALDLALLREGVGFELRGVFGQCLGR